MDWIIEAFCAAILPIGLLIKFIAEPLIATLLDPIGLLMFIINGLIHVVALFLPDTPNNMKLSYHVNEMMNQGVLAINMVVEMVKQSLEMMAITAIVKLYKLIPGKFT